MIFVIPTIAFPRRLTALPVAAPIVIAPIAFSLLPPSIAAAETLTPIPVDTPVKNPTPKLFTNATRFATIHPVTIPSKLVVTDSFG